MLGRDYRPILLPASFFVILGHGVLSLTSANNNVFTCTHVGVLNYRGDLRRIHINVSRGPDMHVISHVIKMAGEYGENVYAADVLQ